MKHFYKLKLARLKKIWLIIAFIVCPCMAWAQVNIRLASGLGLDTEWCSDDQSIQIIGEPANGHFTGCGIASDNGQWYFNPAQAAATEQTFPLLCTIVYTAPDGDTAIRTLMIHKPVIPMAGPDRAVCNDGRFTLAVEMRYVGDYSYFWIPGDGLVNRRAKETGGMVADSQTYVVYVRDTLTGCAGTDSVTLTNGSVSAEIQTDKEYGCVGDPIALHAANLHEDWSYRWYLGDGNTASAPATEHVYGVSGTFPVVLVVNNGVCTDSASRTLEVTELDLELTGPERVDINATVLLATRANQPYQIISWSPSHLFHNQTAYTQQFVNDTTHEFRAIGISDKGCLDSAVHTLIVNPRTMVPSAFSPNGDGRNDQFRVTAWGAPSAIRSFRVFDRWGKVVYSALGTTADTGWDGNIQGSPAEVGVYYYAIEVESVGEILFYKGDVMLMR